MLNLTGHKRHLHCNLQIFATALTCLPGVPTLQHQPVTAPMPVQQLAELDVDTFKQQLYQMWFLAYTHEVRDDSLGFEHVFVGEARYGGNLGVHNWIQVNDQQQKHTFDYKAYNFPHVHRYASLAHNSLDCAANCA